MKKLTALLLALIFTLTALTGCAQTDGGEAGRPASDDGAGAKLLSQYVLAEVQLPELPAEPDEAALYAAWDALDYDKLGEEAYEKAQEELWDDYATRSEAYYDAVLALRGEGVSEDSRAALLAYSTHTASKLLGGASENTVYSPANLYLALAMLTETVAGDSRAQLLDLLGAEDAEAVRTTANALWRELYTDGATSKTLLANSLWLSNAQEYNTETVERLAADYYASVYAAPMGTDETNEAIRAWIDRNTNGLLENAAEGLETKSETVMLLLSTLYFKDNWANEFNESATCEDTFTAASGAEQTVDFMHRTVDMTSFVRGDGYTVAQLSFQNRARMIFLLPDEGVDLTPLLRDETALTDLLTSVYDNDRAERAKLLWSVPKLDVSADLELSGVLKSLGVGDVFDDKLADFTPLASFDEPVCVSRVQHAARVTLDEQGCEAAAFTAIMADASAALPEALPTVEMNLNRPFAFAITASDGLPLFLGVVHTLG